VEPAALVEGIRTVAQGDALVDSAVTRSLIDYAMQQQEEPTSWVDQHLLDPLSEREMQVLTAMARGLSNAQVGEALFLGETTVKSHVSSLLAKLHLRSRVQAVVLAYETGLVARGDVAYEQLVNDS
jgi:DNA-binding NarL/FixJ family response regulator